MKKAVCVLLRNEEGLILGVSRKNDHNDFGLIGGKVDDTDNSIEDAAIRETKEETGLDIFNLKLVDTVIWRGYEQNCFTAEYSGEITFDSEKENHVVKWLSPEIICNGSFGDYNRDRFQQLGILKK